jgi:Lon protease-like protein
MFCFVPIVIISRHIHNTLPVFCCVSKRSDCPVPLLVSLEKMAQSLSPLRSSFLLWMQLILVLGVLITPIVSSFVGIRASSSRQFSSRVFATADNDADADFMKALQARMNQVKDSDTKLPIVVLDSILPRQVFKIEVANDNTFLMLVQTRIAEENPSFGMVGMTRISTGEAVPLPIGCLVQIVGKPELVGDGLRLTLRAGRRMRMVGEFDTAPQGWTEARVEFLDSFKEQQEEEKGEDPMSVARAMATAKKFTSPNMNMPDNNNSLIDRWIELARGKEQSEGQIDKLLVDLGEIPSADEPSELAFWVGALVNPLPGMGVAMEIRPMLLMAKTAEERVNVALKGILESIKHMDGSAPLF